VKVSLRALLVLRALYRRWMVRIAPHATPDSTPMKLRMLVTTVRRVAMHQQRPQTIASLAQKVSLLVLHSQQLHAGIYIYIFIYIHMYILDQIEVSSNIVTLNINIYI
jgi:hypothetical protein